ncbi:MipA/OmpV family protein [Pseudobdellovibrio sp. HCB154]|uniref:MipA/OmpV family protein n=1 Tax=Pseudobdellovibrio sp. HCB154 TaxID=3386277 RepID=UPI0039170D19
MKWTMNSHYFKILFLVLILSPQLRAQSIDQDLINIIDVEKNIQLKKEKEPTYSELEIGIGYGYGSIADYPASDEYSRKSLLLPLVIYRGDVLKSDQEEGTRAELFKSRELEIHLSFGARFNNDSDGNKARLGMPDLNYIFETGPSLNYKLWKEPKVGSLTLQIPLRLTFETDFKATEFLGLVFEPELRFQKLNFLVPNLSAITSLSVEFFNQRVANYYYQVENRYATADRPAYEAKPGLSTLSVGQNFLYEYNRFNLIFGATYSYYGRSENVESPLFKSDANTSVFAAVAWFFYQRTTERQ